MSELTNIFSMLDRYVVSEPIYEHNGVSCYRATHKMTKNKQIVKIISVPATSAQATALMLTGICKDRADVNAYFKESTNRIIQEVNLLRSLSEQDSFLSCTEYQIANHPNGFGYAICILENDYTTLDTVLSRRTQSHLQVLNYGIDLCSALTTCRRSGYLFVNLRPDVVCVDDENVCRIGSLGFIALDSLAYTSMPEQYISAYTPPEIQDAFSALNTTIDVYAVGLILYQAYNNGTLPDDVLVPPANADTDLCAIILKACAPNPEDRWESPMALGQALIDYMQQADLSSSLISTEKANDDVSALYGEDENGNLNFISDMEQTAESTVAVHEINTDDEFAASLEEAVQDETPPESDPVHDHTPKTKKYILPLVIGSVSLLLLIAGCLLLL